MQLVRFLIFSTDLCVHGTVSISAMSCATDEGKHAFRYDTRAGPAGCTTRSDCQTAVASGPSPGPQARSHTQTRRHGRRAEEAEEEADLESGVKVETGGADE